MSRVRSSDTKPEMIVRRIVHGLGFRYSLHPHDVQGRPDLVFRSRMKVIFVHGCFWHQHGCSQYRQPKTKRAFWEPKLAGNKARDEEVRKMLLKQGWTVLTVWECQLALKRRRALTSRIRRFLQKDG